MAQDEISTSRNTAVISWPTYGDGSCSPSSIRISVRWVRYTSYAFDIFREVLVIKMVFLVGKMKLMEFRAETERRWWKRRRRGVPAHRFGCIISRGIVGGRGVDIRGIRDGLSGLPPPNLEGTPWLVTETYMHESPIFVHRSQGVDWGGPSVVIWHCRVGVHEKSTVPENEKDTL
ncbi:hypothetical protein B0H19DRAFT_1069157 [Mycena capillaripes]|nr:hypothetical protein B0H19DRAFT_1069157 [Mycena capillaripes]